MFFVTQETEPLVKHFNYKHAINIRDDKVDIILMFCEKTASVMTENFLGTDEISSQDIQDTLKESVNIIVGNFLGTMYPEMPKKINIPVMITNVHGIKVEAYESTILYFKEEPLNILLKVL
jgi:chemotaxis protein CheY-P-specific phosphatase CheC